MIRMYDTNEEIFEWDEKVYAHSWLFCEAAMTCLKYFIKLRTNPMIYGRTMSFVLQSI